MSTNTKHTCNVLLEALFPQQLELRIRWWTSPNKAFENMTPEQMLDKDPGRVLQYLRNQFSGDYL